MAFPDLMSWADWLVKTSIGGAVWTFIGNERKRRAALAEEKRKQLGPALRGLLEIRYYLIATRDLKRP